MLEDIGMMRMLPGMTVLVPGDAEEARKATIAAAQTDGPVYIRFGRATTPTFTTSETPFSIGKALTLWESPAPRIAFLATGSVSYAALGAARALAEEGIDSVVLHIPTVKPLDEDAVRDAAIHSGRVITIEEHQTAGGFGSAIAEFLAEQHPVPLQRLGILDEFGQSGTPDELLAHYGLDVSSITNAARAFIRADI
jgi:transketolase